MVHQVVLAVLAVLGLISQHVSAQWPPGGQSQPGQGQGQGMGAGAQATQGMGFRQLPGQGMGFGQSSGQGMGFGQSPGQGMGLGQSPGQGMGLGQSPGQGMGLGPVPIPGMGMGQPPSPAMGFGRMMSPSLTFGSSQAGWRDLFQPQEQSQFLTCTAVNADKDDLRVTFTNEQRARSPWDMFGRLPGNDRQLRLEAHITSGPSSKLQGLFRLIVTENSRSEEKCLSRALGDILSERSPAWWRGQSRTPRGIVGTPIRIMQGQTATASESIDNLQFEELAGRGMALCPSHQISGTTCADPISLCCKIGYDSQRATVPFTPVNQMFSMGGAGMQNSGSNSGLGGFNQGLGGQGLNQPLGGQSFDSGLGGQAFGGLNQGGQQSFNTGPQAQGGLSFRR